MNGVLPNDPNQVGNDDQFLICPTQQSILGNCASPRPPQYSLAKLTFPPPLAPQRHWDPVTSQEGDGLDSGPGTPGLDNLGKDPYAADENGNSNGNGNGNGNGKSAAPRSASIPGFVGFALSGLAAALVAVL